MPYISYYATAAIAAPAILQESGLEFGDDVASDSVSFGSTPATTSKIVVLVATNRGTNSGISSVSDNQGNTYTQAVQSNDNNDVRVEIWYTAGASITASGTFTVTVTPDAANTYVAFEAYEVSNLVTSALDKTVSSDVAGGTSGGTGSTSTLANANQIVFSAIALNAGTSNIGWSGAATTGYTELANCATAAHVICHFDYKVVSATTAISASWAWTVSGGGVCAAATFAGS